MIIWLSVFIKPCRCEIETSCTWTHKCPKLWKIVIFLLLNCCVWNFSFFSYHRNKDLVKCKVSGLCIFKSELQVIFAKGTVRFWFYMHLNTLLWCNYIFPVYRENLQMCMYHSFIHCFPQFIIFCCYIKTITFTFVWKFAFTMWICEINVGGNDLLSV